jgi:hypothetical protein
MPRQTKTLFIYAAALLVIGLASIAYDPIAGAVTLYLKGKTGLIVCGIAALLAVVAGLLVARGVSWARWAGIALPFLLLAQSAPKAFRIGREISAGLKDGHFWYQATLFGVIAAVSLIALVTQFVTMRRQEPASAA